MACDLKPFIHINSYSNDSLQWFITATEKLADIVSVGCHSFISLDTEHSE